MDRLLGDPTTCPHGNPIPGSDYTAPDAVAARRASRVGAAFTVSRIPEELEFTPGPARVPRGRRRSSPATSARSPRPRPTAPSPSRSTAATSASAPSPASGSSSRRDPQPSGCVGIVLVAADAPAPRPTTSDRRHRHHRHARSALLPTTTTRRFGYGAELLPQLGVEMSRLERAGLRGRRRRQGHAWRGSSRSGPPRSPTSRPLGQISPTSFQTTVDMATSAVERQPPRRCRQGLQHPHPPDRQLHRRRLTRHPTDERTGPSGGRAQLTARRGQRRVRAAGRSGRR